MCPLLDFTLESENPALNRVVQQVTLPEWFVIATDEDSACAMTLTVPNAIKKVAIFKNGKRYCLQI
jgi:hypothetical protein